MPRFFQGGQAIVVAGVDNQLHVYLAGPDVFKPDPIRVGQEKKQRVNEAGHTAHFPMDPELEGFSPTPETAYKIATANESLIKNSQVMLVNLTPWRGSSMDVGTAHEVGFMSCMYDFDPKHEALIIGYYEGDWELNYAERVVAITYGGNVVTDEHGTMRAPTGDSIENFGLSENLMIPAAIKKTGGEIYPSFELAVENIQQLWERKFATGHGFVAGAEEGACAIRIF